MLIVIEYIINFTTLNIKVTEPVSSSTGNFKDEQRKTIICTLPQRHMHHFQNLIYALQCLLMGSSIGRNQFKPKDVSAET